MSRHAVISYIKSLIRIAGYILIGRIPALQPAAVVLVVSEVVGILEEIGH